MGKVPISEINKAGNRPEKPVYPHRPSQIKARSDCAGQLTSDSAATRMTNVGRGSERGDRLGFITDSRKKFMK